MARLPHITIRFDDNDVVLSVPYSPSPNLAELEPLMAAQVSVLRAMQLDYSDDNTDDMEIALRHWYLTGPAIEALRGLPPLIARLCLAESVCPLPHDATCRLVECIPRCYHTVCVPECDSPGLAQCMRAAAEACGRGKGSAHPLAITTIDVRETESDGAFSEP